jgi:hypothetical protein
LVFSACIPRHCHAGLSYAAASRVGSEIDYLPPEADDFSTKRPNTFLPTTLNPTTGSRV